MSLYCEICHCSFTRKQNYAHHLTTKKHMKRLDNENIVFICKKCNKVFSHASGLSKHKKSCGTNEDQNVIDVEKEKMKKEIEELQHQISLLIDKHADSSITNNNTQNIDTQNNNITITINAFGKENIDYLDDKTIACCIDRVYKCVPAILEKIHFNPDHPENHNIKITNKKLPYASIMGDNKKWKTVDKKDAIEKMVHKGYDLLEDNYTEKKDEFNKNKRDRFEEFKSKFEEDDKELMKNLKTETELLVINGAAG